MNVLITLAALVVITFLLIGCGQSVKIPEDQTDAEIFEQGKHLFDQGDYKNALEYFLYVKDNFLRSPYAGVTRFYAGECYYEKEKYEDAVIEYKSFLAFFPNDPNAAKAQYKLGVSLLNQARDPERDQSIILEALAELQKVKEQYPEHEELVKKTEEKLSVAKDRLAQYEFIVAKFYHHEKRYRASNNRLAYIMNNYPRTSLMGDVLWMQGKNFQKLDQPENAKKSLLELWKNYPRYQHIAEARKTLLDLGVTEFPTPAATMPPQEAETESSDTSRSGIEGYIVLRRDNIVFINLIQEDGIREGMKLQVYRGDLALGTIRVTETQEGFSLAEIISQSTEFAIREDDKVVIP